MNVLLLDDEPLELAQLNLLINTHFPTWRIKQALTGSEAILLADRWVDKGELFQLAFIDIKLPGRNGLEVASILKNRMPGLDLIVVTAFQDFEYAKESIKLRAFDYLVKPVIEKEFLNVLENYIKEHPEYRMKSDAVEKVIMLIKDRYHEPLRLSGIAEEMHFNANYLSRLFSEEVGLSFSEFLLSYRVEMAKQLLARNRQWSVQQIAEKCGFSSQHHLSSAFKKFTQCSPTEYRNAVIR
ncbi:response regulator transcription factor [Bacillus sp. T33-2]|uniref:response regulator transcription factor n=1 Tax=Bacillus sp. T33-2 TaxID=2054168 RepID=UPI000C766713|nr:DNA-binding response regulator [Bacillus sp. T33-2]PLR95871.1 DNA-binding response regulator [Bacillus sp. T33-2]